MRRTDTLTPTPRSNGMRRKLGVYDACAAASTSSAPALEREDWTSFRTLDGLQQKAGVSKDKLPSLVLKELTDNALDAGAKVSVGKLPDGGYFVEDDGPGIEPDDVAKLFSIRRPMVSTKLLRLPQKRGALGNGLRVVAGAVLASGGSLTVTTRNHRVTLRPERDGNTAIVKAKAVKFPVGTRVEIVLGPKLPCDEHTQRWAQIAQHLARTGLTYQGKSSPRWFDVPAFHDLLDAAGDLPVRDLIAHFDGCGDGEKIAAQARLGRATCKTLDEKQATKLLEAAQNNTEPVNPKELGSVGPGAFPGLAYAVVRSNVQFDTISMPVVVEAWVKAKDEGDTLLQVCVNRTPIAGDHYADRNGRKINFFGCGLHDNIGSAAKDTQFDIWLNVITPYMPITSDGKAPDLTPFVGSICTVVGKAVRAAHRPPEPDGGSLLPKRRRGRQSWDDDIAYREGVKKFCRLVLRIYSSMDFKVGSRGWCYLLEPHSLHKGDFEKAEDLITECRKSGTLPLDICAEDVSRTTAVEELDTLGVADKVESLIDHLRNHAHEQYLPISLWDDLNVYVEVVVEKIDLFYLFEPVCRELHVPITNFKGWSDLNSRAAIMRRFKHWEARGKKCVLLICGDHDPGGLHITDKMRSNLEDLSRAVDWSPANLLLKRFGLNIDFIEENGLTWIDNLETSSGLRLDDEDHADHNKAYVQDYIERFGVRKCEANALVVRPEQGRQLCRDAILQHIDLAVVERYERRLARLREQLRTALQERAS